MLKKCLVMYASWTGNTEKVAKRFQKIFEAKGWRVDMFKVDHKTDVKNPPFEYSDYDFVCVGSPVIHKKPVEEMMSILAGAPLPPSEGGPKGAFMGMGFDRIPEKYRFSERMKKRMQENPPGKIVFGPDSKKGVVFMTYSGNHLGPKEVDPAIRLLALEMEHIPIECLGMFSCPGKHENEDRPGQWYKDLTKRPNERDLKKAEIFIEEIIEGIEDG